MSDVVSRYLTDPVALEDALEGGEVLADEELRALCEYCLDQPKRSLLLFSDAADRFPKLFDAMKSWFRDVALRHVPDAAADRFTWRVLTVRFLDKPMLWFRNDQTGLVLLFYRPEESQLFRSEALLRQCLKRFLPVLGVSDEAAGRFLAQDHRVLPCRGAEPENVWMQLCISDGFYDHAISCNTHVQLVAPFTLARRPSWPGVPTPLTLLSRVLHSLCRKDPREAGGVFCKRVYSLRVQIEKASDPYQDHGESDDRFLPLDQISGERLRELMEPESEYAPVLPPEGQRQRLIEVDASRTFHGLEDEIYRAFSWHEDWSTFHLTETGTSVCDEDTYLGVSMDEPPERRREVDSMLLREYFETGRVCLFINDNFLCSVTREAVRNVPVPGPESRFLRQQYVIRGGKPLTGTIRVSGSARTAAAILSAATLCREPVTIRNLPVTKETDTLLNSLAQMENRLSYPDPDDHHAVRFEPRDLIRLLPATTVAEPEMRKVRFGKCLLGACLAAHRRAAWLHLFGANLGTAPMHEAIRCYEMLGVRADTAGGSLTMTADEGLKGCRIPLSVPGVETCAGLMLAAVTAEGETVIENAPDDPLIRELCAFLNTIGARVQGAGTDTVTIHGVTPGTLRGADFTLSPDANEAAVWLYTVAAAGGDVTLTDVDPAPLGLLTAQLRQMGVEIREDTDNRTMRVISRPPLRPFSCNVNLSSRPGMPLMAHLAACATAAAGESSITDMTGGSITSHLLEELTKMGADASCHEHDSLPCLTVRGGALHSAEISPFSRILVTGLVAAGLATEGETTLDCPKGYAPLYEGYEDKLRSLGADLEIRRSVEYR